MGIHLTKTEYNATVTLKGEVDEDAIKGAVERLHAIAYQRNLGTNDIRVEQRRENTRISTLYVIEDEDENYVLSEQEQERALSSLKDRIKEDFNKFNNTNPKVEAKIAGKVTRIFEKIPFCTFCSKKAEVHAMEKAESFRRSPVKNERTIKVVPVLENMEELVKRLQDMQDIPWTSMQEL